MEIEPPTIRNAVRAVILRNDSVLVQRKKYEDGEVRFTLPGGAPESGETLQEGLSRECLEEIGTEIEIVDLIHVADYFKIRKTEPPTQRQLVEFLFRCRVPDQYVARNGPRPDRHQVDVTWLPLDRLIDSPLFPIGLREILSPDTTDFATYLGLIQ